MSVPPVTDLNKILVVLGKILKLMPEVSSAVLKRKLRPEEHLALIE